jgi:hypothetical protein
MPNSAAAATDGQQQQEKQPCQQSLELSDEASVNPKPDDAGATASTATTTGAADGQATSSVFGAKAGVGQRRKGKDRTAAKTGRGKVVAGGQQPPQPKGRKPKASKKGLDEETWMKIARSTDEFVKERFWIAPCAALLANEDLAGSSSTINSSSCDAP